MTTKTTLSKTRQRYSQQYKTESLVLAEKVGVPTGGRFRKRKKSYAKPIVMAVAA